jgi:hypothetical protein
MTRVEVRLGSFSNEAADSAARPTSASPRKLTQVLMRIGRDGPIRPLAPRIRLAFYGGHQEPTARLFGGKLRPGPTQAKTAPYCELLLRPRGNHARSNE